MGTYEYKMDDPSWQLTIRQKWTEVNQLNGFNIRSRLAQSKPWPQPDWDFAAWLQKKVSHKTSHIAELKWLGGNNGPKFFLTVVQVWSTTGNICLRLLLPKDAQPLIESETSYFFLPTLWYWWWWWWWCAVKTWKMFLCVLLVEEYGCDLD